MLVKHYELLKEDKNDAMQWMCAKCRKDSNNKFIMTTKIDKLTEKIDQLVHKISNMEQHINEFDIEKEIDEIVEKKVNEATEELTEKYKRKLNTIVVNLPESKRQILSKKMTICSKS